MSNLWAAMKMLVNLERPALAGRGAKNEGPSAGRRSQLAALVVLAVATAMPFGSHAEDFQSDRISVEKIGEGPDVILIPGLNSSPWVWDHLVEAAPGYRYHLVHIRGFAGLSAGGNGHGEIISPVAEEVARYVSSEGLAGPAVIGHSLGGSIGLLAAARRPASVARLMVVDIPPFLGAVFGPPGTTAETIRPVADGILAQMNSADAATRRQNAEREVMVNDAALRRRLLEDWLASDPDVWARALHEVIVTDLRPNLGEISAPTTVLYVKPPGAPVSEAEMDAFYADAYSQLANATLKRIPESSHFIMLDQPERFLAEVVEFLH